MRFRSRVSSILLTSVASVFLTHIAWADDGARHEDDTQLETIVVTAPFQSTVAETAMPVGVLFGEALTQQVANSLGETLKNEVGIYSSSFGTSVGHPVIRGQSGNRVMVLQGGIGVTDVSNASPDHAEGVEAILADRIEVLRGPSTLLYGSGAVGGVVNVIDSRVPSAVPENFQFLAEQTRNSVNDENKSVIRLDAGVGSVAFHANYFTRDNSNVEIPGFAIDEAAAEAQEELLHEHGEEGHDEDGHDDDDDHGHDEEEEEFENTNGFLRNSDAEADGGTFGASIISDNGFLGFSVSRLESDYGLPAGSHSHGHDEGHDEDEEEEHHDEEEEEHGDVEFVRIDLEKTRYDLRGEYSLGEGFFQSVNAAFSYTDYEHNEVEFFEDGDVEIGTTYSNQGTEGRITVGHGHSTGWSGVWGLQMTEGNFSAVGEEAFIPETDVSNFGLFIVERLETDTATIEIGARLDSNEAEINVNCGMDETAFSLSGSVLFGVTDAMNVMVSASRSERTPSTEELFSNIDSTSCATQADPEDLVLHAATNLLEVGNPNLENEIATNIDVGLRWDNGPLEAEVNIYHNEIVDYIFLDLTGAEYEEQLIAEYQANDATFTGFEGRASWLISEGDSVSYRVGVFADSVNARFDRGGNVPRIPPSKVGFEFRVSGEHWTVHLNTSRVDDQDDTGEFELATEGYTNLSLYADYHWDLGARSELQLFARGTNLLDEEIRNHTSLVKNFAPDPGQSVMLGLRFRY